MCCLTYEYATYQNLKKKLPKLGKSVKTSSGQGKVIRHNAICNRITVRLEGGLEVETTVNQLIKE
jgi:cell fate regulator YaaT (PSP1 superfamily)